MKLKLLNVAIMLGLSLPLIGCDFWENNAKTERVEPEYRGQPKNAAELIEVVKMAGENNKRVRMTGSGHSASDVAITKDVLLTPEKLNKPLAVDATRLKNTSNDLLLARTMSGIKIRDLSVFLEQQELGLKNMGGYDGQTIVGAIMTATHGSGLEFGPIADQVASMQMVISGGKVVQIEPRDGITDPKKFPGYLEENSNIPVELIQDDDIFNAARVSIGSMGIVYSVTLNTDKKYWGREVRHLITWKELKKPGGILERAMSGKKIYDDRETPQHWELQYTPYKDKNGDYVFLITDRYKSYEPLPLQSSHERGKPGTTFVSALATIVNQPVAKIVETYPSVGKFLLKQSLESQVDDNYTNIGYEVLTLGVINKTPSILIEASFDIKDTVAAIEYSFEVADKLLQEGAALSAPIAIRFVKESDAFIATQEGRDSMFMEVISLQGSTKVLPMLRKYQTEMHTQFGARPHWGLDLKILDNEEQVSNLYPKWDKWKSTYRKFNDGTFDGKVTDRLGISIKPR